MSQHQTRDQVLRALPCFECYGKGSPGTLVVLAPIPERQTTVKTFISVGLIAILLLSVMNDSQAQKRTGNRSASPRANTDWHSSWDRYLKAVQKCLNQDRKREDSCTLSKFKGQTVNWEGIYKGMRQIEKIGEVVDLEMTPGSMTDSAGETVKVASSLAISAAAPEVWRKLTVGQRVRFRARTSSGFLGAGFFPTSEAHCCYIVDFDGKVALVKALSINE